MSGSGSGSGVTGDGSYLEENAAYSIVVRTSADEHSSTDGKVFIQLSDGEGNMTSKCSLKCSLSHRRKFQRGHSDLFVLCDQNPLADIKFVDVWLERKDDEARWKLHSINVIEHSTHQLYRFKCGKWLDDPSEAPATNHAKLAVIGEPFTVFKPEHFEIK